MKPEPFFMMKFLEVSYLSHVKMHQNKSDYHTMNECFLQDWFIMAIIFLTFFIELLIYGITYHLKLSLASV